MYKEYKMKDITILKEKNPSMAAYIEAWRNRYQRSYDFSKTEDQATFYEGLVEMGKHVPINSGLASIELKVNSEGVESLTFATTPKVELETSAS
jgi:hypothetical protein